MTGRKMHLEACKKSIANGRTQDLPQKRESEHHDHRKKSDAPMLSLEKDFDQTVKESSEPQEPLKESCR